MEKKPDVVIAAETPIQVHLNAGQEYLYCTCGLSGGQPFCGAAGQARFVPVVLTVKCGNSGGFYNFSYCMHFRRCDILTMEENQIGNRKRGGKTK